MPERRFWFFRTTIQAFCLVIEKGAVDYCVLSISLNRVVKYGANDDNANSANDKPFLNSQPLRQRPGNDKAKRHGEGSGACQREKTLPRYSGLTVS